MTTFLNDPWPYLTSAFFVALIILYIHKKPRRPGVSWLNWLLGVHLVWALAGALATVVRSLPVLYDLFVLQSICSLWATALELMVVLEYTGSEKWIARRILLVMFLPPMLLAVIAYVFPASVASITVHSGIAVIVSSGAVKWGFYAYVAIIFSIIFGVLLTRLMRAPASREPILLLMVGAIIPVVAFAVIRPQWISVPPIQASILLSNFTMLAYFVALYSFQILQVIPVARDMLISRMPYGLIVIDSEDQLVDFNSASQALPEIPGKLARHRTASQALGSWWDRLAPLIGPERVSQDIVLQTGPREQIYHVSSLPLLQASGWRLGHMFLLEDITQARQAQLQHEQAQRYLATLQERERLARELHDSLGQTLAAAHLQASTARVFLAQGEITETDRCLEQMADMTIAAEVDVREYLLGVRTAFSPDHCFFRSLRRYIMQLSQQYGLVVDLSVPPQLEGRGLAAGAEMQLMRIIQEALSNIRKHARAKKAHVVFTDLGQQVQIAITDDGRGFDPDEVSARQAEGFGLYSMRERAEALGGRMQLISQPGQGTQVLVHIPTLEQERLREATP